MLFCQDVSPVSKVLKQFVELLVDYDQFSMDLLFLVNLHLSALFVNDYYKSFNF